MLFLFFFFSSLFSVTVASFLFRFFFFWFYFVSHRKASICWHLRCVTPPTGKKIRDSHFRVFKEYPQKCQIWKSETSPKQGTWLGIPLLRLVSLCQIWDFYGYSLKYPKISNNGNLLFFSCVKWLHALTQFPQWKPWVPGDTYWCILILKLWRTQVLGHFC